VSIIGPHARAIWFDLESRTERVLDDGEALPAPDGRGFLWVDLELPAPDGLAALVEAGVVPRRVLADEAPADDVSWDVQPDHVHLALAGARLHDRSLILDRRRIVITDRAVTSLHRGLPRYVEDLRERYRDDFARFARSHGFLLFEMCDQLLDQLQGTVRVLGDHIDELRVGAARVATATEGDAAGAELLASVLLLRRILVRTRDVLAEASSRRSAFVPETTQPYLGDMAMRLDGLLTDLAFSRDVLSDALRAPGPPAAGPASAPRAVVEAPPSPAPTARPPLTIRSLGGFEVARAGEPVPESAFGEGGARELLAALLCARRVVSPEELRRWLWPGLEGEAAALALEEALAGLRAALDADTGLLVSQEGGHRVALGPADRWDADELLRAAERAPATIAPERRIDLLTEALEEDRGSLLPEWPNAEWSLGLRAECERARASIRAALADALLQAGRPREAGPHFQALLAGEPEHEAWHRGLMRSYAEAGDRALALRQFHTCRSVLRRTRGVEPSAETESLYLELLGGG
jgi:DNA-binding SARP family transcriptional activator/Mg2+ and Co2+ transporter CorA